MGRDVFYCCVCACPPRDMAKALKKSAALNAEGPSRRRKRSMALRHMHHEASNAFMYKYISNIRILKNTCHSTTGK